jgi:hypothetical protein
MQSLITIHEPAALFTEYVVGNSECVMNSSDGVTVNVFRRDGKYMILTVTKKTSTSDRVQVSTGLSDEIEARAEDMHHLENTNIDLVMGIGCNRGTADDMKTIEINTGLIQNHVKHLSDAYDAGFTTKATTTINTSIEVYTLGMGIVWDIGNAKIHWVEQDWDAAIKPSSVNAYKKTTTQTQIQEEIEVYINPHLVADIQRITGRV